VKRSMSKLIVPNAWVFFVLGFMNYEPSHGSMVGALCAFKQAQTAEEMAEVAAFLSLASRSSDDVIRGAYAELDPITYQHLPNLEPLSAMHIEFWEDWQKCP
jgi:hypothetical protein